MAFFCAPTERAQKSLLWPGRLITQAQKGAKHENKSKKTALLMSFTSLLICFAMLVGSTFAWFTDTASTGVNKIVSGKLKVDIVGETGDTHLDTLNFTKAAGAEDEQLLWEPGAVI